MSEKKNACDCRFAEGVMCNDVPPVCSKCGWNPKVSRRRLRKIKEGRNAVHHGKG